MKLDFGNRRITIVLAPVDMRYGYAALSRFAQERLFIDPDGGGDVVVLSESTGRRPKSSGPTSAVDGFSTGVCISTSSSASWQSLSLSRC